MQISTWSDLTIQHFFLIRFYHQYSFLLIKNSSSSTFYRERLVSFDFEECQISSLLFFEYHVYHSHLLSILVLEIIIQIFHTVKNSSSIVFLWSRSWNSQTRILRFSSISILKSSKEDVFRQYHFSLISIQKSSEEDLIAIQYCLLLISI
jgi:hypothetical protein